MLFLDRIEIVGFKSFCDKTILKIPSGITAILGPNGCGKSNVVDAMNWVLGEQSAKTLRSDKMEEVIFNGSKNRKPVNMAQVSLIWKTDRDAPGAPEVTIARRLFRSGESQYEMNGEVCRLKDIHGFFLKEGFDPLAYSILEQGKIDFLFLSKPMERRALIEEVAGVAEFKHKKRAAQLKLADNQLQLERIQDILQEVEKQLSSLKRQAAKARRYQILKDEKQVIQQIFFHKRFAVIQSEERRLQDVLATRIQEEETAAHGLRQHELVSSERKLRLSEIESELYRNQEALRALEIQLHETQNLLQSKRQRIEELQRSIQEKETDSRRLQEEEIRLREAEQVKTAEEGELRMNIEQTVQEHANLFSEVERMSDHVGALEQRMQDTRRQILEYLSKISHLKNEQIRLHTHGDLLTATLQTKELELVEAQQHRAALDELLQGKKNGLGQASEEIGYLDTTKRAILEDCERLKIDWDAVQQQVQSAFKRRAELQTQLHKLDAQQHSSKFYNESARSLLSVSGERTLGMMMDFIETDPQYETAVENFLADKLNYLIVHSEDGALSSIDYLKQEGLGYCGFVIKNGHDPNPPTLPEPLRQEEGFVGSLREVVQIPDDALPAVAPFMETAVVVSNLESAKSLIKKYPDYQYVTMQGDVILSPALYAGGAKADDVPGLIAIQREKKEFIAEQDAVEERIKTLEEQVLAIQDRLELANRELVKVTEVRESKNKDRMMIQMEIDQIDKEINREDRVVDILKQELQRLANEKDAVEGRFQKFTEELEAESTRREECETQFAELEQQGILARQALQEQQSKVHEFRVQIAEMKERDRALITDVHRLQREIETLQKSFAENQHLIQERHNEIASTEQHCRQLEDSRLEMIRSRDQQKTDIEARENERQQLGAEIADYEAMLQEARTVVERIRGERTQIEIEKARIETQKEDLILRCREEMAVELHELTLPESEFAPLTDEELKQKLIDTDDKIEKLGSINMLALEEYTQMEERHRFLKTQYDDLKVSIDTLLETIQRIDTTSLQRFREAYDAVQNHFQDLFQRLFNGGKAEMVLTDPENPNESGIDIQVQPPGKRLQNMNLLSGGEKTLTGIAFLMALFQFHASPFCMMDEVDAALDEANVQRFTSLLRDMRQQIQFIIVTHNKRSMEAADQLYGVTMGEPGVSTILSARFEEAEALIQQ